MKKTFALFLCLCMILALAACGTTGELYIHETKETQTPAATEEPVEPDDGVAMYHADLGTPVIFSVQTNMETYKAPDDSGKIILSFGYNVVKVYLENNPEAAEAINLFLAREDENFYTGVDAGSGVNALLEQALDNFGLAQDTGISTNTEFSCMRSVNFDRGDSRVVTLRYRVNSFTGGTHGEYHDVAFVFDTASGKLLTIDDVSVDRAALDQALLDRMHELIDNDVRYQIIRAYMETMQPDVDLDDALKALIRDGSWELDEKGLTVFSDIYEIGSYADGIYRFTLAYDELEGLIKEDYLPVERTDDGELQILDLHGEGASSVKLVDMVLVSQQGEEFRLFAQGTVYDVTIDSVTYIDDDVGFYKTEPHWYCSYLSDAGVQVGTEIPEGMPNLLISYHDASGDAHNYLVTRSGEDGSVLLKEETLIQPVG